MSLLYGRNSARGNSLQALWLENNCPKEKKESALLARQFHAGILLRNPRYDSAYLSLQ